MLESHDSASLETMSKINCAFLIIKQKQDIVSHRTYKRPLKRQATHIINKRCFEHENKNTTKIGLTSQLFFFIILYHLIPSNQL